MVSIWLIEIVKGIGKLFINPLFYWLFFLLLVMTYRRIKKERRFFGLKIFNAFSEWRGSFRLSLLLGLILSLIMVGLGLVFSIDMIIVLALVTILCSLSFNLTFMSASYTLGFTYLLMTLLPNILSDSSYPFVAHNDLYLQSIVLLLGLMLIVEAIIISRSKRNDLFPQLKLSQRGIWVGVHHIKKLTMIPFFVLIPNGSLIPFADFWPYISVGEQTYQLVLIPFLLGFNFKNMSSQSEDTIKTMSGRIALLGFIVVLLAIASLYVPVLAIVTVIFAILGREIIFYRQRMNDRKGIPYYTPLTSGLRVLSVKQDGPADKLGLLAGETIVKVNDIPVSTIDDFYKALQNSGASFKLDVIDDAGEVRFLMSAFYDSEHHELGIIFPREPFFIKKTEETKKSS